MMLLAAVSVAVAVAVAVAVLFGGCLLTMESLSTTPPSPSLPAAVVVVCP
jgi:hypothetical protein